jgi:hypothetical protein
MFPFHETIQNNIRTRTFDASIAENDLYWHRDIKDRIITVKEGTNWQLQMDNQLPQPLIPNKTYHIPKETWHRINKGTTILILEIKEID